MAMIIKRNLKDRLNESLAKDMEPAEYKKALEDKFSAGLSVNIETLSKGEVYHNPPVEKHTSKREAYGTITWIEYWRRLIGFNDNHLKCSFCGADIYIDVDAVDAMTMRMSHPKTDKGDYQAVGGHYYKNGMDDSDGYVIVPVCRECNGRSEDFDLEVKETNQFVEEIGATIKSNDE